jgi:hypothetical protein
MNGLAFVGAEYVTNCCLHVLLLSFDSMFSGSCRTRMLLSNSANIE